MSSRLSKYAFQFLKWFCPDHLYEEIEGDLIQKFNRDVKNFGEQRAKRRSLWNVIRFFRPGIVLRNNLYLNFVDMTMLRKNITLAFRHLTKDWTFSTINIFGLSISMAACFLIFQYALFELSYDKQYKNYQNIFRVTTTSYEGNFPRYPSALSSRDLPHALKEKFLEVEAAGALCVTGWFDCTLSFQSKDRFVIFNQNKLRFADQSFLTLFNHELIRGDAKSALTKPFSAVLSVNIAKKYFGEDEPMGKILHLKGSFDEFDCTVTGVMQDPAPNSHIDAEILLSPNAASGILPDLNVYTYILLNNGVDKKEFANKLQPFADQVFPPKDNFHSTLILQPIASIHLHSHLQDELTPNGSASSVYFLMAIALVVLVIAWINYINLATSRAVLRAKEVGIRKITGATRKQIIFQFVTEAFLINSIGLLCAIVIIYFFAPVFYNFVDLSFPYLEVLKWNVDEVAAMLLFVLVSGIVLAGYFPARIISSFSPVKVLKGKGLASSRRFSFRQAAVVFQFVCSIALLISVVVFNRQFDFLRGQDLGIDITKTVLAKSATNMDSSYRSQLNGFKNQLKQLAIIQSIATSVSVPGDLTDGWTGVIWKEKDKTTQDFGIYVIDPDFIPTYKLKLLAGRNFQYADYPLKTFGQKLEPVIVNRTATQRLGFKEPNEAIGEFIYWGLRKEASKCVIIGVIDDYHQESFKELIKPLFYTVNNGPTMTLKLTSGGNKNISQTIATIQQAWNKFFPNNPIDYSLLEDGFNKHYQGDEQISKLFNLFCALAIAISALGILALSLFSMSQRMKEISIRKVLGASVLNLLRLLTKEYLILIAIAAVVAMPISYWGIQQWLNGFAIKIQLNALFFFVPIAIILVVGLTTVGSQALKAALSNPVDNLKNE